MFKPFKDSTAEKRPPRRWYCIALPVTAYPQAWRLQIDLLNGRIAGSIGNDMVLFVEHLPVFTLGRRGGSENITVPDAFLKKAGISVIGVERGGDVTYHGPGQLVVYPIVDLKDSRIGVVDYVGRLEEVMIRTLAEWNILSGRNTINRGVWVGDRKIGSIGVAVRRGVAFHGFCLNVTVRLEPFQWINPCGLKQIGITSMARELSGSLSLQAVRSSVKRHLGAVFDAEMAWTDIASLCGKLTQATGTERGSSIT